MSINTYFSWARFSRLLKQDLIINKTKYLLKLLLIVVLSYVLLYFFLNLSKESILKYGKNTNEIYNIYFFIYTIAIGVIVGTAFPDLTNKIKTATYLLAPGSILEKLVVQFFIRIVLFIPIALGIFWINARLAKASLVSDLERGLDVSKIPYFEFKNIITNSFSHRVFETWQIYFMIFGLFSYLIYLFAGATFFKSYTFVKTVIFSAVVLGTSILFMIGLSHLFYDNLDPFDIKLSNFPITDYIDGVRLYMMLLSLFSWLFFISCAYFKLKEREV